MHFYDDDVNAYFVSLAKSHQLPYVSLHEKPLSDFQLQLAHHPMYLQLLALPISETSQKITVATAHPTRENIEKINAFFGSHYGKSIHIVVTSRQEIRYVLSKVFQKTFINTSANIRNDIDYQHSASYTLSFGEKIFLIFFLGFFIYAIISDFLQTGMWLELFLAMGTTVIVSYKMGLSLYSLHQLRHKKSIKFALKEHELPIYTILIPLLREKEETIAILMKSLEKIDYPKALLDVKFLLEEDDTFTQNMMKKFKLPWYYDIIIIPPGKPRSKPHACNYALQLSFGAFLTIYDAEDCPDPNQLKSVLQIFHDTPEEIACIQAALNFYNKDDNWLTKMFTMEYTHWFDFMIPALSVLRVPVPLGGTSNHFKMPALRKVGGWDPYIGTEDAEIGMRLYRQGYRTATTSSTTYEEANTKLLNWFLQRSRWAKGYMQTYLINMRDPLKMIKQVGMRGFLGFQYFVGGNVFIKLANLPLWIFMIMSFAIPNYYFTKYNLNLVYSITWYNFIISNLILLGCEFIAVYKRRYYKLLPYIPLKIFYWILMSFAGYYAVIELILRPGYWYKTEHGIAKQRKKSS